jgi:AraC-like DNA-binding protein
MELLYKKETSEPISSLYVKRVREPVLDINWHFHEEFELIYILKGNGIRLVGDNLSNFQSGELVLVGPNIPHLWRTTKNVSTVDRIIIKFDEIPTGVNFFSLPEFSGINALLKKAKNGIYFGAATRELVHDNFLDISEAEGAEKWISLLRILDILSKRDDGEKLSNPYMKIAQQLPEGNRLSKVISFISENYDQDIALENIADIAAMTVPSFCRYFKKRTNKTFIQFLNEYRIGKACVLLVENKLSVSEIWYELGFNSSTNFNKIFKKIYHCTPMEYRKKYVQNTAQSSLAV